ncbi:(2Fe-2S) ferredoxin domain-containing protein [Nodosilinea sp. P-1105]|uniref:(2Fe-2S) ferredoxin domain-containing protein n=1 Tax=Nodosilinea sp. P-1105 TaxID=2546229 RepID=UPI001469B4BC|nr:(2Fe-2S) ferredoxin domain-containing protein [Nodosilinea sp. P-1105]NMF85675.1 (2Fe-2S) ferredoxin domain-containing protein [Nodosilinea sp. P-1105]
MTQTQTLPTLATPAGQVLKGQYQGAYRSGKGKLKGLRLQAGTAEYTIKLPKYLRPMLVRELEPGDFIQVWAYPEDDIWRSVNILPLPEVEIAALKNQDIPPVTPVAPQPQAAQPLCIEVCTKGKCCKQGSRHLWSLLQTEVKANPDLGHVSIKATGCLKACKHGPNLRVQPRGKMLNRVTSDQALALLKQKP